MIKQMIKNYIHRRPNLATKIIKFLSRVHTYSHHKIAELASILEGGKHPKHRITNYHQFFLSRVSGEDRILDVGCGVGFLAYQISAKAKGVVGIDFSEPNIAYAKHHHQRSNLKFVFGDVTTYAFNESFDKIILSNVLEHIDDRVGLLKSLSRISDTILFRVPMENRDWLTVYKKEIGVEYRLDVTHRLEYRKEVVESEAARAGWRVEEYEVQWGEFWAVLKRI